MIKLLVTICLNNVSIKHWPKINLSKRGNVMNNERTFNHILAKCEVHSPNKCAKQHAKEYLKMSSWVILKIPKWSLIAVELYGLGTTDFTIYSIRLIQLDRQSLRRFLVIRMLWPTWWNNEKYILFWFIQPKLEQILKSLAHCCLLWQHPP